MKKTPFKIAATAAVSTLMALPFMALTSCDAGEVDTSNGSGFDLGNRYDEAILNADLAGTAVMPQFLLAGDTFENSVSFTNGANNFGLTLDLSEFGRGFDDGTVLTVNSNNQLANIEGISAQTENVNYLYSPNTSSFSLTEENSLLASLNADEQREQFEIEMEDLENITVAQEGSLGDALLGNTFDSADQALVFATAAETVGLIASDITGFNNFVADGSGINFTSASARIARTITYTPTSNNAQLLANGTITGTVTIVDETVGLVVFDEHDGRGSVLSFDPSGVVTVNGVIVDYDGIFSTETTFVGTFTYTLGSDIF